MQISGHVEDAQVRQALDRAARATGNLGGLMRTLANQQFRSTVRNFQEESFDGRPWPGLADSTAERFITGRPGRRASRKRKDGKGYTAERGRRRGYDNILHPTGRHLLQTIHQSHTEDEARVFTANPWAFVHNFGAPMKQGWRMPRRTFMDFSAQDRRDIVARCKEYLLKSVIP